MARDKFELARAAANLAAVDHELAGLARACAGGNALALRKQHGLLVLRYTLIARLAMLIGDRNATLP